MSVKSIPPVWRFLSTSFGPLSEIRSNSCEIILCVTESDTIPTNLK